MEIQGRRALVLGGTSGIGLATAASLRDSGAEVIAASRRATQRDAARETLGDSVRLVDIDLRDRDAMTRLFEELAPIDILVGCATGGERAIGPFPEMDLDGFQGSFDKLWGYANAVRLGLSKMSEDGTIVLLSGSPARKTIPGLSALAAVGGAVEAWSRAIAPEIAPRRINVVSPGTIDTEMFPFPSESRDATFAAMTASNVIPRAGRAQEVADAVLFLIRNDFITGTTVDVDGGALLP
jgi:NAD(P)-dependent dehydrogenase (short-subunit alcohol dehydrogenase family)